MKSYLKTIVSLVVIGILLLSGSALLVACAKSPNYQATETLSIKDKMMKQSISSVIEKLEVLRVHEPKEGWRTIGLRYNPWLNLMLEYNPRLKLTQEYDPLKKGSRYQCGSSFSVFAVRQKGGEEIVLKQDLPLVAGVNTYFINFGYDDFADRSGMYNISVITSGGCLAASPYFWIGDCDYRIGEVTFSDGRPLSYGFVYDPLEDIIDWDLAVEVFWNKVPGCEQMNEITVSSVLSGEEVPALRSTEFLSSDFDDEGRLQRTVQLIRYGTALDCFAAMRRGDFIPLNVTTQTIPSYCDSDPSNDSKIVEVRIIAPPFNDLELVVERDFSADVTHSMGTTTVPLIARIRNLRSTEVGTPLPEIADVEAEWVIEAFNNLVIGKWRTAGEGTLTFPIVRTMEWSEQSFEARFRTEPGDQNRRFSAEIKIRHIYMDSDLSNNRVEIQNIYP